MPLGRAKAANEPNLTLRAGHAEGHVRPVGREAGQRRQRAEEDHVGAEPNDPVEAAVRHLVLHDGVEERAQLGPLLRRLHLQPGVVAHAAVGVRAGIVMDECGRVPLDGAIDERVGDARPTLAVLERLAAWPYAVVSAGAAARWPWHLQPQERDALGTKTAAGAHKAAVHYIEGAILARDSECGSHVSTSYVRRLRLRPSTSPST